MSTTAPELDQIPAQVYRWKPYASQAAAKYGIPLGILLAQIDQESSGNPGAISSAGAQGLTQFTPEKAAKYHVEYGTGGKETYSQVIGAAHLLSDLGFASNPRLALEKYNGDPGSAESTSYADSVLSKAQAWGTHITGSISEPAETIPTASATSNPLIPAGRGTGKAIRYLAYAVLFTLGAGVLYVGLTKAAREPQ
jgi:membrane-bound lytic murein transglycosylase B